jgi:O-antigen/teichoic acid export membrane protein
MPDWAWTARSFQLLTSERPITLHNPAGRRALLRGFGSGIAWNTLAAFFGQGTAFAIGIIVANLLGQEAFGEYSVIRTTLISVAGACELALGFTANRYVSETRLIDRERTGRIIGLCFVAALIAGTVGTIALLTGAREITLLLFGAQEFSLDFAFCGLFVLFSVLAGLQSGLLSAFQRFDLIAKLSLLHAIVFLTLTVAGIMIAGLMGVLVALVVSAFIRFVLWGIALRRVLAHAGVPIHVRQATSQNGIILRYAVPSAISGLSVYAVPWLCAAILLRNSEGFREMALYSAASSIKILVLLLPNLIYGVGISLLNSRLAAKDASGYRHMFWSNVAFTSCVVLLGAGCVAILGPWILRAFGAEFINGYALLIAVVLTAVPEAVALAFYQVVQSEERMWRLLLRVSLPRDIAIVIFAFTLAPHYGAFGLAMAYAIAWSGAIASLVLSARDSPLLSNSSAAARP